MAKWKRTCKDFEAVRKMIYEGDVAGIMENLRKICIKLALTDDDFSYDFSSLAEDIEMETEDATEETADYYLSEFYDLCDVAKVWLGF